MTTNNICKHKCADPACNDLGCLNQPGWKFRDDILFAYQHKKKMPEDTTMDNTNEFLNYLIEAALNNRERGLHASGTIDINDNKNVDRIEREVGIYEAGRLDNIPTAWAAEYKQFMNKQDPAYATYLALKERFE